ncbi:hypothetical protein GMSM_17940 [Geomonas sp. Red276]
MSDLSPTIPKDPVLTPAEDFYRLRLGGIGFIEEMGSRLWTDYNEHDPGITILEALCYAITDLAYRIGWDMKDLLTPKTPATDRSHPYPNQPFFTAREILTVNPATPDDFRRLLIDLELVRNAWIFCKKCACDVTFYAWCQPDSLRVAFWPPLSNIAPKTVWALGMYEALLELEEDPHLGDLNDRKIVATTVLHDAGGIHTTTYELRFPDESLTDRPLWELFLASQDAFDNANGQSFDLTVTSFSTVKGYDIFSDPNLDDPARDLFVRTHWRSVFYVSFTVKLQPGGEENPIENAGLRLLGDNASRGAATAAGLKKLLEDKGADGFIQRYRKKEKEKKAAVESAKDSLQAHRNLDEDYCRVRIVGIEEVAVCADVELTPDADIELVQARIWFEIDRYFNPPVPFYSMQELLDAGEPVEEIFDGPELENGFIRQEDLEAATLKTVLRVSDIIDLLMDIDGVVAVNHLQLTQYDSEGNPVSGAADPSWVAGKPVFDPGKSSASWLLFVSPQHQPRLYLNASRFFFTKGGLPFLPRMDEALDTLTQLRGAAERPKVKSAPKDLPIPLGTFREVEDYFPVQYSFPLTYGIGKDGLPTDADAKRRGQAKQLKGYLLVFEQILADFLAQIAHTGDLFSLDPTVTASYFVQELSEELIQGYNALNNGLTLAKLQGLAETPTEFQERRNRFLDHVLARFGEQFNDYALLLTGLDGRKVALDRLIADKIAFIGAYPQISHDRGKAFDYRTPLADPQLNIPGIKKRVSLLLGYPDLTLSWTVTSLGGNNYGVSFRLRERSGGLLLEGNLTVTSATADGVIRLAYDQLLRQLVRADAYRIDQIGAIFRLSVKDAGGNPLADHPGDFATYDQAQALEDELLGWSAAERLIVVEHLLLRPKFFGDALFPACVEGTCATCGEEDPYSFRLTFVMPGWSAPFNTVMEARGFADRTIRQETPSHLLPKICWVGNEGFIADHCDPVILELARLLVEKGKTSGGDPPAEADACACAQAVYQAFSELFSAWYADKTLTYFTPSALDAALSALFAAAPDPASLTCTTELTPLWGDVQALMTAHFHDIVLHGWQFERFEDAWQRWLEANAAIDWTEEHPVEEVTALLARELKSAADPASAPQKLEQYAVIILADCGTQFHAALETAAAAGNPPTVPDFTVTLPGGADGITFQPGTDVAIKALLKERYQHYPEVSYRLWVVVNLLAGLRNSYPPATLHDCDEGNDKNPVRLGTTALGN